MRNKKALIIIVIVVAAVAGATLLAALIGSGTTVTMISQTSDESAASSTVASFGQTLQQVSIMAPDAATMIASNYAPYVDPALLQQWESNPQSAPGRVVSSPWPDHIQIDSITSQGSGYVVNGEIVFMSSTGVDNTTPIVIQLANENGSWKIIAFQGQATQ